MSQKVDDRVASRDQAYWDTYAKRYDRSMKVLGRPVPRMLQLVSEGVGATDRVLEVAAGTGIVTRILATEAREVVATDYAPGMVAQLRDRVGMLPNVKVARADIYALDYDAASFDVVVAANVLHLVPDLPDAIEALAEVLVPGGRFIAPTYCHDETWTSRLVSRVIGLTGFPGHRRFSAASLAEALRDAGLDVRRRETIPGLLPIAYVEAVTRPSPK